MFGRLNNPLHGLPAQLNQVIARIQAGDRQTLLILFGCLAAAVVILARLFRIKDRVV